MLCASLGIETSIREDHAPYVAHWIAIMKQDSKAVVFAAAKAQKAADLVTAATNVEEQPAELAMAA
jgi:antirestriction protein ArdC